MDVSNGEPPDSNCWRCFSCTTFNILAPIYKRLNSEKCESEIREFWIYRNERILERLLRLKSSIICLQELWLHNEELVRMYEKQLGDAAYATHKLARTNNRGDGLLTAVNRNHFRVLNYKEILFNGIGDRVAQLLHVELLPHFSQNQSAEIQKEVLVVNTHLIFPHDFSYCFVRLQQVYKILQYVDSYSNEYQLSPVPVILCGDWNGSKKGLVYKFLQSQGFVSSYDLAHLHTDNDGGFQKWISHRNHRGNMCGVDFIWLRNPNKCQKPLKECYLEAIYGDFMHLVEKWSSGYNLWSFFRTDGSYVTHALFSQTFKELGICGGPCDDGLSDEDINNLWDQLDVDNKGFIDLKSLSRSRNPDSPLHQNGSNEESGLKLKQKSNRCTPLSTNGFCVKKAVLFPPEVEKGEWPDHYVLSDHAHLTVEFCPVKMHPV